MSAKPDPYQITPEIERLIIQAESEIKNGEVSEKFNNAEDLLAHLKHGVNWKDLLDKGNKRGRKLGITSEEQVYEILDDKHPKTN